MPKKMVNNPNGYNQYKSDNDSSKGAYKSAATITAEHNSRAAALRSQATAMRRDVLAKTSKTDPFKTAVAELVAMPVAGIAKLINKEKSFTDIGTKAAVEIVFRAGGAIDKAQVKEIVKNNQERAQEDARYVRELTKS